MPARATLFRQRLAARPFVSTVARAIATGTTITPYRPGARELIGDLRWWEWAAFGFLLLFCAVFYAIYEAPLFFDANVYYLGGVSIFLNGIFTRHDFSDLRTYGYPLIVALGHHVSRWTLLSPRTAVVLMQILLYAGAVLSLRLAMARFRDRSRCSSAMPRRRCRT